MSYKTDKEFIAALDPELQEKVQDLRETFRWSYKDAVDYARRMYPEDFKQAEVKRRRDAFRVVTQR
jgi:hypothetical protein